MELSDLIKKFEAATGKDLPVPNPDIMECVLKLYRKNNDEGIKEVYNAYRRWMVQGFTEKTEAEISNTTKLEIDFICNVADHYLLCGNVAQSLATAIISPPNYYIGPVRVFYRHVIGMKLEEVPVN